MSTISDQLMTDMKTAMKAGDKVKLGAIRYLRSELKNAQIDQGELDLTAEQKIIRSLIKKTAESVQEYAKAGRPELADAEQANIDVWQSYLPAEMSDQDLQAVVSKLKAQHPDLAAGPLIGKVKAEVGDQASGQRIVAMVNAA